MEFLHYQYLKEQALTACQESGRPYPAVEEIGPIMLALVGDGVFSLYVRMRLLPASTQVRIVHTMAAKIVSAKMQALAMRQLADQFTEAEQSVIRRGRNAHSLVPKSASAAEYHLATAMETLLGWLLLTDQYQRLTVVMEDSFIIISREMSAEAKK